MRGKEPGASGEVEGEREREYSDPWTWYVKSRKCRFVNADEGAINHEAGVLLLLPSDRSKVI